MNVLDVPTVVVACINCLGHYYEVSDYFEWFDQPNLLELTARDIHDRGDVDINISPGECKDVKILDYYNLPTRGEISLKEAQAWFDAYSNCDIPWDAVIQYIEQFGGSGKVSPDLVIEAEARYVGAYKSCEEFAKSRIEQEGLRDDVQETLEKYFDYERYAHDLENDNYLRLSGEDTLGYSYWFVREL